MEEARATRASVFPRETLAVALPAAAEGLVQADRGLQAGQSQLHGGILRRVQRALRFEDRQQGFRAGLVAAVGEIEGALRLLKRSCCCQCSWRSRPSMLFSERSVSAKAVRIALR